MPARVPQDVDLEDRLLFGLTATRFGELAVAVLAAFAAWRLVPVIGAGLAAAALAVGALFGWARWRGRPADHWAVAYVLFVLRTRRVEIDQRLLQGTRAVVRRRLRLARRRVVRQRLRVLDSPVE